MFCPQELYGITGYPLGHSLSPGLHNWGFAQRERSAVFMAWPVPSGGMEDFVRAVRVLNIRGACVTIPHKEAVLPLLEVVSERARRVGAVNTLYWHEETLCGENTDVLGFMAPLQETRAHHALVLGAGGAARAVIAGLQELGVPRITVVNRHADKAETLARYFGVCANSWETRHDLLADMVINTTPQGMAGPGVGESPFDASAFARVPGGGLAYDLVYNPLETRFLREARAAGWRVQDGLDMFVAQGLAQFQLWTKQKLPAKDARHFLEHGSLQKIVTALPKG